MKQEVSDEELLELKKDGLSINIIAEILNLKPTYVSARLAKLKKNGYVFHTRTEESLEKDRKIVELKEQGKSQNEIAKLVHINASGVSQRLKTMRNNGIEIKEPKNENELMNERIIELRKKGMKISEIAKELNSNVSTISHRIQRMKKRGIEVSKENPKDIDSLDYKIEELKRNGLTQVQISKELKISSACVSERVSKLNEMGVKFPEDEIGKNSTDKRIIEMRANGASNAEISKELGIGIVAVGKRIKKMKKAGIDVPESMTKKKNFEKVDKAILNLYEQGESPIAITEKLNLTKGYASKRLLANGIRTRKSSNRQNRKKLKEVVGEEKLAKAIVNLHESKKATKEQLQTIADYYGVDLNIVTKLAEYVDER